MLKYRLPILIIMVLLYILSIIKIKEDYKLLTVKEKYQKFAIFGLLGGSVFIYFRIVFPFLTQFKMLDVVLEFFIFIHLFILVSYFFVGKNLSD